MIRPCEPSEWGFVIKAWIRTYANSDWALLCTAKDDDHTRACEHCKGRRIRVTRSADKCITHAGPTYWTGHHAWIERAMQRSNVSVLEADDGLLEGFVVRAWDRPVLHYVYVKPLVRGVGKAKELVADLLDQATTVSHLAYGVRLPERWRFDPYAMVLG